MAGQLERAGQILAKRPARDAAIRQSYHEQGDKIVIRTSQDVEPAMQAAAAARRADRENRGRSGKRGEWRRTMSTPINVYYAVCQRLGIPLRNIFDKDVAKRITKELKKPEFAAFRTTIDRRI